VRIVDSEPILVAAIRGVALLALVVVLLTVGSGCTPRSSSAGFPVDELDGVLDCPDDSSWSLQGSVDPSVSGASSAQEALNEALAPYMANHDLDMRIQASGTVASLTNGSGEVVIASVVEAAPGNWVLSSIQGCSEQAIR